ncbi:PorP/SprF family type IX secretion system membrane protein [Hanstruepera flava]|uniref:PorP/SprF family type IX secretion system membrane protein n=1 Tax=Hanstruepera flava TaxID=2930218 RepID=UPI002027919E|nr:PorP/SprF family type IX secretion system membrane protein [Hanstruepera flava]
MIRKVLAISLICCLIQLSNAQENDGVVAFDLPVRNSLTYNQYTINPTFSFVRQQHKYVSITNKREWVSFDDAPLTYLASYSGRFRENIGIGVGLFQQNYGVLTTFGGILNFAYNAQLNRDSNLTFGLNVSAYSSGVNDGKVVTNTPDPSLQNIPSNFLLSVSPGINYGMAFIDVGIAVNNAALYNFSTSELIKDDSQRGIQAHLMYTGYMYNNSFLDESKFTGLVKAEFKEDNTIISGTAMLTIPLGIWAQAGYNTFNGFHGGVGLNITKQISVEYNYEKATGDINSFGSSHELTLAYKFNNKERYSYSREDKVSSLFQSTKKKNTAKPVNEKAEANRRANALAKAEAEEQARLAAEGQAKAEVEEQARLAAESQAKAEAEEQARLAAEALAKAEAEEQLRLAAEAQAKAEVEEQARLAAEAQAKAEAEEQARLAAEAQAKAEAEEQARLAAEAQAKAEAEEQARLAAEAQAKAEAEEQARLAAEAQAKAEAEEQARLAAEAQAKAEAEEQARLAAEAQAKAEAEEQARLAAEAQAKAEAEEQARLAAKAEASENAIPEAQDELGKTMNTLVESTEDSKETQEALLIRLQEVVISKDKDLKDLKEENDLSEQGIYMEPKPFKSISAENKKLAAIQADLDAVIEARNKEIKRLEELYNQREESDTINLDEVSLFHRKKLKELKAEQEGAIKAKANLEIQLEEIKIATDFERKRRIKRAAYKNQEDRYAQDAATLKLIKDNTPISAETKTEDDFDFGEARSKKIQIVKNVANEENGYYVVLAVHSDVKKRDEFITNVVASGDKNINFFYDVNTSKYYIYQNKFDNIQSANNAVDSSNNKPYKSKMSIVKIEN